MPKIKIKNIPELSLQNYTNDTLGYHALKGGNFRKPNGEDLNIKKHYPEENREDADIEAEKGEIIYKTSKNELYKIGGKSHSKGGTPIKAEDGDIIFSNYLKIDDPELLKHFNMTGKKPKTIAEIASQYLKLNEYVELSKSDDIKQRNTGEMMINNINKKLMELITIQEGLKGTFSKRNQEQQNEENQDLYKAQQGVIYDNSKLIPDTMIPVYEFQDYMKNVLKRPLIDINNEYDFFTKNAWNLYGNDYKDYLLSSTDQNIEKLNVSYPKVETTNDFPKVALDKLNNSEQEITLNPNLNKTTSSNGNIKNLYSNTNVENNSRNNTDLDLKIKTDNNPVTSKENFDVGYSDAERLSLMRGLHNIFNINRYNPVLGKNMGYDAALNVLAGTKEPRNTQAYNSALRSLRSSKDSMGAYNFTGNVENAMSSNVVNKFQELLSQLNNQEFLQSNQFNTSMRSMLADILGRKGQDDMINLKEYVDKMNQTNVNFDAEKRAANTSFMQEYINAEKNRRSRNLLNQIFPQYKSDRNSGIQFIPTDQMELLLNGGNRNNQDATTQNMLSLIQLLKSADYNGLTADQREILKEFIGSRAFFNQLNR